MSEIWPRPAQCAVAAWIAVVASLVGRAPSADTPISLPVEVMVSPWGPFARQCDPTRVSHDIYSWRGRVGIWEVANVYGTCTGFSAMPSGQNAEQITASVGEIDQPESPTILRILRTSGGAARAAAPGDTGLLARGSDAPETALMLAGDIGLTARQLIHSDQVLSLPVRLSVPFHLDILLNCHPDGGHTEHGRDTLVFSCTLDQKVRTDHLDAQVQLAGVEEIDVQTGVRLSSVMTGRLSGRSRASDDAAWQSADDRLLYRRETEFE